MNGTSNGYDLQSVCNGNGFIGIINELSQIYLAIYGTSIQPFTYTGSENMDITNNQVSLNFQMQINRAYDGVVFDMLSGTHIFDFRQNTIHGGQPIAIFNSETKVCTFHGDCSIPLFTINHLSVM